VTKAAQVALARGIAESLVGTKITVSSILAGPTKSEGVEGFVANVAAERNISAKQVEQEFFETMRSTSLIRRFATTTEIASLVAYVCSPEASGITGSALRVDGGVVRSIF
jgi:NAD(P)-dependent dehydrogenase (short-subunit alcohol dehydrogenase family)